MRLKKENGFSLIELVVVVAVLSVLSAIAVPAFNCFRRRAISNAALATLKTIQTECEVNYFEGIDKFTSSNLYLFNFFVIE